MRLPLEEELSAATVEGSTPFLTLSFWDKLIKTMATLALAAVVFAWVVQNSGSPYGNVVVHVTEANVEITLDDFRILIRERRSTPITLQLPPGQHCLRMIRDQQTLYEERFILKRDEEVVLTASPRDSTILE